MNKTCLTLGLCSLLLATSLHFTDTTNAAEVVAGGSAGDDAQTTSGPGSSAGYTPYTIPLTTSVLTECYMKLEGNLIHLPIAYQQMVQYGWTLQDPALANQELASGNSQYAQLRKGNSMIEVEISNISETTQSLANGSVSSISFTKEFLKTSGMSIELPGGFLVREDLLTPEVIAAFGTASYDARHDSSMFRNYHYLVSEHAGYGFYMYDYDNGIIESFFIYNDEPTYARIDEAIAREAANPTIGEVPPEAAAYQVPAELGSDIDSGIVQFKGDLYQFPIPLTAFINNGWTMEAQLPVILEPGNYTHFTFNRGNDTFFDMAYNLNSVNTTRYHSYLDTMSTTSGYPDIVLPGSIKVGSTRSDLLQLLEGKHYEYTKDYFNNHDEYRIFVPGSNRFISIEVDNSNHRVGSIFISMDIKSE